MSLEQHFPFLFGTKHGFVRRLDIKAFEKSLKRLDILDRYFDVSIENINKVPARGKGLIVGNHGPAGMDAPFLIKHIYERRNRVVRGLADRALFKMPVGRVSVAQMGVIEGEREQAIEMLNEGNLLSVYPGGIRETVKTPDEKYQLRQFWGKADGFVKVCLATGAPIIPVACVGIDEIFSQLRTSEQMKDNLLLKITQWYMGSDKYTIPLYMGMGPFPHKVKLTYLVGDPIEMKYGPEAIDDPKVIAEIKEQVIVALEDLLDKGLADRHIPKRKGRKSGKVVGKIIKKPAKDEVKAKKAILSKIK